MSTVASTIAMRLMVIPQIDRTSSEPSSNPIVPYSNGLPLGPRRGNPARVGSSQAALEDFEMRLGILALSLVFVMPGQNVQDETKKELEKLQGKWAIATFNGQDVPSEAQAFLVFDGDKYEQWNNGSVDERGTIKIDPKTKPMSVDLIITEGTDAGKTQPGLYELTDSTTLWVGLTVPGNTTRPSAIANAELQVLLKKVK
jgi:uncharacterized protein (TIGR03067 family)